MTYDILGRMTSRIDDAAGAGPQTSSWTYDLEHDGSNAKGKLTEISGPGNYFKYIFYDGQQRENRIDETIDGTVYRTRTSYDTGSRISTVTYPSSYVISITYNAYGHLTSVTDPNGAYLWRAISDDERGNIT